MSVWKVKEKEGYKGAGEESERARFVVPFHRA